MQISFLELRLKPGLAFIALCPPKVFGLMNRQTFDNLNVPKFCSQSSSDNCTQNLTDSLGKCLQFRNLYLNQIDFNFKMLK